MAGWNWLAAKWGRHGDDDGRRETRLRAARWFHGRERFFQAVDLYLEAEDYAGVAAVTRDMSRYDVDHISVERHLALIESLERRNPPDALLDDNIELLSHYAWAHFLTGDADRFCAEADRLQAALVDRPDLAPDEIANYSLVFSLDFRVPILDYARGLLEQIPNLADMEPDDSAKANSLTQNLPLPHRSMRDFSALVQAGEEGYDLLRATFGVLLGKDYGVLEKCFRAGFHFDRLELDAALAVMRDIGEVPEDLNPEVHLGVRSLWQLILSHLGRRKEAERYARETERFFKKRDVGFLLPNFRAFVAEAAMRWHGAAAGDWLERYGTAPDRPLYYCRLPRHFATARALAATGKLGDAVRLLERLRRLADEYRRPLDFIEANVLLCQALWRMGESLAAVDAAALAPALRLLAKRREGDAASLDFITGLLAFENADAAPQSEALPLPETAPRLGDRQVELLRLLAKGFTTQRIADESGLSPNTVKHHLGVIFRALGVTKRAEAVRVAKALGVIGKG